MAIATRSPLSRPKAPRIVLAILCVVALVALTQCKMTADKVTGVATQLEMDKAKKNRGNCVSDCAHKAEDALKKENDLHKKNVKKCKGDNDDGDDDDGRSPGLTSSGSGSACLDAENARHDAAVDQIQEDRRHCIDGCHHQGGGRGGR